MDRNILWIIILIAIFMFDAANKSRRARQQAQRPASQPEAEPERPFPPILTTPQARSSRRSQKGPQQASAAAQAGFDASINSAGKKSRKRAAYGENRPSAEIGRVAAAPEPETESEQPMEFDLRKAVIYSEILKPKFEE